MSQSELENRYGQVCNEIQNACQLYQRTPDSVKLIAVSKRHSADNIAQLAAFGQRDFAENYLQEALEKQSQLAELNLTWHFIGHIQSRKCKQIAANFDWVHTIDSEKVADKLQLGCEEYNKTLNVLIQVNLQDESSKAGVHAAQLVALAKHITALPNLVLQGIMIIPKAQDEFKKQREVFSLCAQTLSDLRAQLPSQARHPLNQLSMGMSNDMPAAIAAGSTMIRIGTAIFGARD